MSSGLLTAGEEASAEGGRPLLDTATHSVGGWSVTTWEGCGEWTIVGIGGRRDGDREYVPPGQAADPTRARQESARRARAAVRRYCAAHGLDRLGTLTFAVEPGSLAEAWKLVEAFRRDLEQALGQRIPLLVVPEYGERSGRLHFHFAFGRYLDLCAVRRAWPHGFVDLRRIRRRSGPGRRPEGRRAGARRIASYVAGYVAKGEGVGFGRKRYSTTRGCQPVPRTVRRGDLTEAIAQVLAEVEGPWEMWSSAGMEGWCGPPVLVIREE